MRVADLKSNQKLILASQSYKKEQNNQNARYTKENKIKRASSRPEDKHFIAALAAHMPCRFFTP